MLPGRQRKMLSSELWDRGSPAQNAVERAVVSAKWRLANCEIGASGAKWPQTNSPQRKMAPNELWARVPQRKMASSELSPAQNGVQRTVREFAGAGGVLGGVRWSGFCARGVPRRVHSTRFCAGMSSFDRVLRWEEFARAGFALGRVHSTGLCAGTAKRGTELTPSEGQSTKRFEEPQFAPEAGRNPATRPHFAPAVVSRALSSACRAARPPRRTRRAPARRARPSRRSGPRPRARASRGAIPQEPRGACGGRRQSRCPSP